ncbi:MAG TPA: HAMP domain-containing sensor histidine kinase [Vicinamibacteria bacterium]|nr:HAMP domain-containing sensor histidine kinase [Vicinamibacteria bacterium]
MTDIQKRLAAVSDTRGRIVSIFVGAVLLPSVALSVLSFNAVPKHAENLKISLLKQAQQLLYYAEQDLEQATRRKALEAARAVGPERLLEGRRVPIAAALAEAGMADIQFDSLRLEAWSKVRGTPGPGPAASDELRALSEALTGRPFGPGGPGRPPPEEEDAVPLTTVSGEELGVVRFRFTCDYAHRRLVREFFEKHFVNPEGAWVIRVTEPGGEVLYENARSRSDDRFEVERSMTVPSYEGVRLLLRYRDRSIEQEVRRLAITKTALIGFIDVILLAGLGLVWTNVRRELRLSRLKSDFVANVSHELKTPLALIRLFAETLELGRVPTEEKKKQYHGIINKESRRLSQLINNILDFSRIEAGRKEYRLVRADLGAVVRDVVDAYRFPIEQQGFALTLDVADDLPDMEIDPEALSQALINLLNNAIKYSPQEKSIRVSARREGDRVLVTVQDRGAGIPKAEQKRIFEKFYRVENSLVHTTKGSGLGLALVQHIMEAHGGRVEVASAPGEGSAFTLSIPVGGEGAAEAPAPARRGTMGHRETIEQP